MRRWLHDDDRTDRTAEFKPTLRRGPALARLFQAQACKKATVRRRSGAGREAPAAGLHSLRRLDAEEGEDIVKLRARRAGERDPRGADLGIAFVGDPAGGVKP